jgi:hypothetical protein
MRHALIAVHLVHRARDAASTEAEAGRRLEHQAQAKAGRSARVATLARRVRALAAPTEQTGA